MNAHQLLQTGLRCLGMPQVVGEMRYEAPICMGENNVFRGDCSIGAFTYMNNANQFTRCSIGRYCSLGYDILVGPGQHETCALSTHPFVSDTGDFAGLQCFSVYRRIASEQRLGGEAGERQRRFERPTRIGNDVWIGSRAMIMNGINVGDGAVIGAGAIVTRDVAPYTVVAGVPARVLRKRFDDALIAELLELRWWRYDLAALRGRVDYADVPAVLQQLRAAPPPAFAVSGFTLRSDGAAVELSADSPGDGP